MVRSAHVRAALTAAALSLGMFVGQAAPVVAQSTTGTISGVVRDDQAADHPRRDGHSTQRAHRTVAHRCVRRRWSVPLPEPASRRVRADRGAREFRDLQAVGPEPGAEPGRGNRRDAAAGRCGRVRAGDGGHAAAEHDQRRGRGPLRHAARGRTAGGQQPGHHLAGPAGAWRVAARGGAEHLRIGDQLLGQRHAVAIEQLHARRPGQQRPERVGPPAADEQHGRRAGGPPHHQPVRRRVRPCGRVGHERDHQVRHQPVPRIGVRVPQRQQPELAQQPGQGCGAHRGAVLPRAAVRRHGWRPGPAQPDVLLRGVPEVDAGPARIGHHPQRRAHGGRSPDPRVDRRHAPAGGGAPALPAGRADAARDARCR